MLLLRKAFLFFVLFFFIFAPRLSVGPSVNMGLAMVAVLAVINLDAFGRLSIPRPFAILICVFSLIGFYSYCMAVYYGNDPSYFPSICLAVVICVIFGWGFARAYTPYLKDESNLIAELMILILLAALVNSVVMLCEYFIPGFKDVIESIMVQADSSNIDYAEHAFRLRGLASAGGAALSIVNALGVVFVIYLVRRKVMPGFVGLVASVVLTIANIFAGRTGLIASLCGTVVLLIFLVSRSLRSGPLGIFRAVVLLVVSVWFIKGALNFDLDSEVSHWAFEWVDNLGSGKASSTSSDELESMLFLPTDVLDLLFGVGFFEGEGAKYIRSDSGYIKTVLSIGIVLGTVMYAVIGWMFYRVVAVSREYRWLVSVILVFMYIAEIKEPFLYQNYAARVLFLLSGSAWYIVWHRKSKLRI